MENPEEVEKVIEHFQKVRRRDHHFFSNAGKTEREKWIVRKFLDEIDVSFEDDELETQHESSKIDVVFRAANFQVKEIANEGIHRTLEAKEDWLAVEKAVELKDLVTNHRGGNIPEVRKGYDLVVKRVKNLEAKYPKSVRENPDLLFYITRTRTTYIKIEEVNFQELSLFCWRSISCVMGDVPIVLFANESAPEFIREKLVNKGNIQVQSGKDSPCT